ncbi:DUF6441 family protein [Magnetospirillum moscoviense]|uniref:Uncharacterized protein n=1 Tax=Magnetospirillum moscoviense TaxID=1437059 RepID=A0A178MDH6_9PROT|nr:DUF6441 family protein [Magnetospirillum moscoviense]OAN46870.1 hypothetical protein A6A05_16025 [Magnetospirillum moscoviense]
MRVMAAIRGDLGRVLADEVKATERAASSAMRDATNGLKLDLRAQITGAGLGQRLANSWRSQTYPDSGNSLRPAGLVWSKAPHIIRAFDEGATIRSADGFWLAVPGPGCPARIGKKRPTPRLVAERLGIPLRFVYRRGGPSLLVADDMRARTGKHGGFARSKTGRNAATAIMFLLYPQVTLRKRLDINRAKGAAERRLVTTLVSALGKNDG